jgi:hypothetical protein
MLLSQGTIHYFCFEKKKRLNKKKNKQQLQKKNNSKMPTQATVRKFCSQRTNMSERTQFAILMLLLQKKQNLYEKRLTGAKSHWSFLVVLIGSKQHCQQKEAKSRDNCSHCIIYKLFLLLFFFKCLSVLNGMC